MKKLKIYVAARAKHRTKDVAEIQKALLESGHTVTYDWAANNSAVKKPYREPLNRKWNQNAQETMLRAAAEADIFILLDDEGLRGAYMEFGAFLKDCLDRPSGRKAYIVGPNSHQRESIFESPEYVIFTDKIEGVYKDLGLKNLYDS